MFPRRSLRFRLALWNSLVIGVALLLLLAAVRVAVVSQEYAELDAWLFADAREIAHNVETIPVPTQLGQFVRDRSTFHADQKYFVSFVGSFPLQAWATDSTPEGFSDREEVLKTPLSSWRDFRIASIPVRRPGLQGMLYIGAGTQQIQDNVNSADRLLMLLGGIAIILIPILAWTLAGMALRPVVEMIHTAERLQPESLSQRLPHANTNDELDRLARSVNGLLDRVGLFVTKRRDLLANAAHELRTPLAAIRSTAEVALGQQRSPEEYEERLASIIDQGSSLEQLINQLLFLAEAEGERAMQQVETVDLNQLIERSTQMFRAIAESKGINFQYQGMPALVSGNRRHLSMMANNLIDNALKFTPTGGSIEVSLVDDPGESSVLLEVRDSGMGIEPEDLPRIFERFFRADRARERVTQIPGSGLGLSLVEAIVQKHGGLIDVVSEVGKGTCFSVRLPRHQPAPASLLTTIAG